MKSNFRILVLLTAGFMSSAFADTASQCGQSNASFIGLVQEYQACNSITGSDLAACSRFCADASKIGGSGYLPPAEQYCSQDQIRKIEISARSQGETEGRQQGRNEVLKDLQAREDFVSDDYYGANEDDCGRRVSQATQGLRIEAIKKCNDKAVTIKNCSIQSEKVIGSIGRPPVFEANGNFRKEDNRSSESECKQTAEARANAEVLKKCQESTGSQCSIISSKSIVTYRVQSPSGPRFGRRDDRICDARGFAEAAKDLGYKCSAKISVRNQAFSN